MIFWIILAVIIGLLIWVFISGKRNKAPGVTIFATIVFAAFISLFIGLFVFMAIFAVLPKTSSVDSEDRTELKALTLASSNASNSFFLGNTYEGSARVINYIAQETDGENTWSVVSSTPAKGARIFEDETKSPYLVKTIFVYDNPLVLPWTFQRTEPTYDFHVPKNSIVEDYKVEN